MQYNPDDKSVRALVGSGQNSSSDGRQDSWSFKKLEGICSADKTLFVTDVSARKAKIVTSLSETISFLGILGSLYDTFGIHSKGMTPEGVSLKQAKEDVTTIDNYVKDTVSKVKERYQLSETSATSGPVGNCIKDVSLLKKDGQVIQERDGRNLWNAHLDEQQTNTRMTNSTIRFLNLPRPFLS